MEHDQSGADEASALLTAYDRFRHADLARQARVRSKTGMGDNELRLVRYLLAAQRDGADVRPSAISRYLGISSASTTALLDRLERAGTLQRVNDPTDRRSILITPTATAAATLAATVDEYEQRVTGLAEDLDEVARRIVIDFLDSLTEVAEETAVR